MGKSSPLERTEFGKHTTTTARCLEKTVLERLYARIQVEALDRTKLLRDVSTIISDAGVNILSANVATSKRNTAIFRFIFEVSNLGHLDDILKNVRKIDTVFDAHRVIADKVVEDKR